MNLATSAANDWEVHIIFKGPLLKNLKILSQVGSNWNILPQLHYWRILYRWGWRTVNWRVALPESPKKEKVKVYAQVNWQIDYVGQGREKKIY